MNLADMGIMKNEAKFQTDGMRLPRGELYRIVIILTGRRNVQVLDDFFQILGHLFQLAVDVFGKLVPASKMKNLLKICFGARWWTYKYEGDGRVFSFEVGMLLNRDAGNCLDALLQRLKDFFQFHLLGGDEIQLVLERLLVNLCFFNGIVKCGYLSTTTKNQNEQLLI